MTFLKYIYTVIAIVFASQTLNLPYAFASRQACPEMGGCSNNATIILIDRTTPLTSDGQKKLTYGINAILYAKDTCGFLIPYEVRNESFAAYRLTQQYYCVPPYLENIITHEKENHAFEKLSDYIDDIFRSNARAQRQPESTVESPQVYREEVAADILSAKTPPETYPTELIETFSYYYKKYSRIYSNLNFYIFSDLEDKELSLIFNSGKNKTPSLINSLLERKQLSLEDIRPRENTTITVWGIGRSEIPGEHFLTPDQVNLLISFWNAYFSIFALPENISITKEFPSELFPSD